MTNHTAEAQHEALYQDLVALIRKHAGHLSGMEMLAVAANMVGKLIALQDQRSVSPATAMETVRKNIELGNQQALDQIGRTFGNG